MWLSLTRPSCGVALAEGRVAAVQLGRRWPGAPRRIVRRAEQRAIADIADVPAVAKLLREMTASRLGPQTAGLALPDHCGRVALFEFDSWPAKAAEGEALLRWRFQKELNVPTQKTRVVSRAFEIDRPGSAPSARRRIVAMAIRDDVVAQYETVAVQAGLIPVVIGLSSLHALDLCRPLLQQNHHQRSFFVSLSGDALAVFAFRDGAPTYVRIKAVRADADRTAAIAAELIATLQFYAERAESGASLDGTPVMVFAGGEPLDELTRDPRLQALGVTVRAIGPNDLHFSWPQAPSDPLSWAALAAAGGTA